MNLKAFAFLTSLLAKDCPQSSSLQKIISPASRSIDMWKMAEYFKWSFSSTMSHIDSLNEWRGKTARICHVQETDKEKTHEF